MLGKLHENLLKQGMGLEKIREDPCSRRLFFWQAKLMQCMFYFRGKQASE